MPFARDGTAPSTGELIRYSGTRYADLAGTTAAGSTAYTYDDAGRVTLIRHTTAATPVLVEYGYGYDAADQLTSQTEAGATTSFGYDDAGQLTQDEVAAHAYDGSGNRTDAGTRPGPGTGVNAGREVQRLPVWKCSA
jgi:YD repeat-containing protein